MNYVEIYTSLTGTKVGFVETISQKYAHDNDLTIDGSLIHQSKFDDPTVVVYPIRVGKILKCYVRDNSSEYQIYSVSIFNVVRFVYSKDLIFLPTPPIEVGDTYIYDSKSYTVAKTYPNKILLEREDDVQLITHYSKHKQTVPDDYLNPEVVKYIARMLREKGHDSQLLTFINMVNTYNRNVDQSIE